MTVCMYVNQITPHLMPLAREMVRLLGEDSVRYIYVNPLEVSRRDLGWGIEDAKWIINRSDNHETADKWLAESDILICERRELDLWERRARSGKGMYYTSERWFKPIGNYLPGWLRLLSPRFYKLFQAAIGLMDKYPNLVYLADGYYAAEDFVRLRNWFAGKGLSSFRKPRIECEQRPLCNFTVDGVQCPQLRMWGYFVAPSSGSQRLAADKPSPARVLWMGRYLDWKRVDTLIEAVLHVPSVKLDLYGQGPMERRLRVLAANSPRIVFRPPVPVETVREIMRMHDVYVLPSNGYEGWGAVVNEALEEGMLVLGTYEAGASRAILPEVNLFHSGNWRSLATLLANPIQPCKIGEWSVRSAAEKLIAGGPVS